MVSVLTGRKESEPYPELRDSVERTMWEAVILTNIFYKDSVADSDPGSGAFLTPGSGIRNRFFPDPGSRIPNPYF
jgi:hypothetical protein